MLTVKRADELKAGDVIVEDGGMQVTVDTVRHLSSGVLVHFVRDGIVPHEPQKLFPYAPVNVLEKEGA
jgi:preprotein translocase subunit YajC